MNACSSAGDNRRRCLGESPLDGGLDENHAIEDGSAS